MLLRNFAAKVKKDTGKEMCVEPGYSTRMTSVVTQHGEAWHLPGSFLNNDGL